jgi:hypothetical protein
MQPPELEGSVVILDRYVSYLRAAGEAEFDADLGEESKKRIRQLARCLARIVQLATELESTHEAISQRAHPRNPEIPGLVRAPLDLSDEIERETESFYETAWRLRNVIRTFPGQRAFELPGVRDVRNKLIVHPEKHGNRFLNSFQYSTETGPVLKPQSSGFAEFSDLGLWSNAVELRDRIRSSLRVEEDTP